MNRSSNPDLFRSARVACLLAVLLAGGASVSEAADPATNAPTVITSKRFTYETAKREAVFEQNVVVKDPRLTLHADRLHVKFNAKEEVETILATGTRVVVEQDGRKAGGRGLHYDLASGRMVLREQAWVQQGENLLRGDQITMWRDEERVVAEPNVEFTVRMGAGVSAPLPGVRKP